MWRWANDGRRIKLCAACRKRHAKRRTIPECQSCNQGPPYLFPGVDLLVQLGQACRTQWRMGFGGPYGLDLPAVFEVARILGLTVDVELIRHVGIIEAEQLAMWAEARPAE